MYYKSVLIERWGNNERKKRYITIGSSEGICEDCGRTVRLEQYNNRFGTYMYCKNCYDLNHFLDN